MPEPNKTEIANYHFYKVWALKMYLHANNFKCILYRNYCFFFLSFTYEVQWSKVFPKSNGHYWQSSGFYICLLWSWILTISLHFCGLYFIISLITNVAQSWITIIIHQIQTQFLLTWDNTNKFNHATYVGFVKYGPLDINLDVCPEIFSFDYL